MHDALFKPFLDGYVRLLTAAQASQHPKAKQFADELRLSVDQRDEAKFRFVLGIAKDTDICAKDGRTDAAVLLLLLDDTIGWELWSDLGRACAPPATIDVSDIPEAALTIIRARMQNMQAVIAKFPNLSEGAKACLLAAAAVETYFESDNVASITEEPCTSSKGVATTKVGVHMNWPCSNYFRF